MSLARFVRRSIGATAGLGTWRAASSGAADMDEALGQLQQNPFYDKYAVRLAQLRQAAPDDFLKRAARPAPAPSAAIDTRQYSSVLNPKEALPDNASSEEKKLETIFKVDLVKDKDGAEIQGIWEEYHKNKEAISATIPSDKYGAIRDRMREFPTFLFPLPRTQGYEFIVCQSLGHTVHFTPLLAYQVHKENAPECLNMIHYTELQDKGIILMRGEYDKNVLNAKEAQCLANQFQLYYGSADEARTALLQAFSRSPSAFRHMDLIAQLENITLP